VAAQRHYSFPSTGIAWIWDSAKDRLNRRKHGLSLADGVPALGDPLGATRLDPGSHEERWQTVGRVGATVVLLVVHTDPVMQLSGQLAGRIISVRKATKHERKAYEEGAF
jgi:uncharacterized protein